MKFWAVTTLSAKLSLLLCASCMGVPGMVMVELDQEMPPCHQEVAQEDKATEPCEMCEMALEAWEENAVANSDIQTVKVTELIFVTDIIAENFVLELKPLEGAYLAYYPPPQVLLKAVTPNTKTIVLLS